MLTDADAPSPASNVSITRAIPDMALKIAIRSVIDPTGICTLSSGVVCSAATAVIARWRKLLALLRGHWHSENRAHWVRDVTVDDDRSRARGGAIPAVLAALRNTAIGLLRAAGATNIAAATRPAATRSDAARPREALTLLGVVPTTA
jgi:hypothetical protein